jgi:hypothetical protein
MVDKTNSTEAGSKGASNTVQDEQCKTPWTAGTQSSTDTVFTFETADASLNSTRISVTSTNELLVAGKLHVDIMKLQTCYLDILNQYDPCTDGVSKVTMLTNDQMLNGISKHRILKDSIRDHLFKLLDHVRPICTPNYTLDTRPRRLPQEQQVETLVTRVEHLCSQNSADYAALKGELDKLQSTVSGYKEFVSSPNAGFGTAPTAPKLETRENSDLAKDHGIPHIGDHVGNYIQDTECAELFDVLKDHDNFNVGNGRSTLSLGAKYDYNGSRGDPVEFPPCVKKLLDKINADFCGSSQPLVNSCLVTKYVGPQSSIPRHQDNERAIHHDSNIFTVSLGHEATIEFTDAHHGAKVEHKATHGSLYTMSRLSQDFFSHQIHKNSLWNDSDCRISLTFRSVHWRNNNSTLIMGDSNTKKLNFAKFDLLTPPGDMRGTFGNAMPGKHTFAYVVDEIDPLKCAAVNNIVLLCGINDVRQTGVTSDDQIRDIFVSYKTKVAEILMINKRARIFICPLLPTKDADLNRKVLLFNGLIFDDLVESFAQVSIIHGINSLCDRNGKLSGDLSEVESDPLNYVHINQIGRRVLCACIKSSLFQRKRAGGKQFSSRSYAGVAKSAPDRPSRRGGRKSH